MPHLREQERKAVLRVETWKRLLAKAEEDLMEIRYRIARKEATMAAAIACLQQEEEKKKKLAAELAEDRPKPSKSRRLS